VPNLRNIFEYGCIGMIGGHIDGWSVKQENFGQTGLGGVVEEYGIDDFSSSGAQSEGDIADAEDGFDVRDLLLDETD
jgi:hypothetical protein